MAIGIVNGFAMAIDTRESMRWLYERSRPARGAICRTVLLGWAGGCVFIVQAFLLSRIIHGVVIEACPREALTGWFAGLAAAILLRAVAGWWRETSGFAAGARVRAAVRMELLGRVFARGPAYTRQERTGALASVLVEQVEGLQGFYALYLPQLALVVLLPLTIAAAVFPVSWAAGLLLLATAPMIPLFTILVGMGAESVSQRHFQSLARMSAHFLDVLQGLATLKLFDRSREEADAIARVSADYRRRTMSVLRVAFLSSAVIEFFASLSIALVAVYLGMSYLGYFNFGLYGQPIALADGLFILLLAPEFYLPLRELGAHYHARARALAAAEEIRGLLQGPLPSRRRPGAAHVAGRNPPPVPRPAFCLRCRAPAGAERGQPGTCPRPLHRPGGRQRGRQVDARLPAAGLHHAGPGGDPRQRRPPERHRPRIAGAGRWAGSGKTRCSSTGACARTSCWGSPMRARIPSRRRPGRPECWISHAGCPRAWIPRWASRELGFPAARPSGWRWRGSF